MSVCVWLLLNCRLKTLEKVLTIILSRNKFFIICFWFILKFLLFRRQINNCFDQLCSFDEGWDYEAAAGQWQHTWTTRRPALSAKTYELRYLSVRESFFNFYVITPPVEKILPSEKFANWKPFINWIYDCIWKENVKKIISYLPH
jgi:hypothetical protein